MPFIDLDHVNIETARLSDLIGFYRDVLGLSLGPRPPFSFGGAWIYCGDRAVIHLVEADDAAQDPDAAPYSEGVAVTAAVTAARGDISKPSPRGLSHFALRATGLIELVARLRASAVPYRIETVPGFGMKQVHLADPDGNHLHIDFAAHEPLP